MQGPPWREGRVTSNNGSVLPTEKNSLGVVVLGASMDDGIYVYVWRSVGE